jgi:hypothetical protein
MALDYKRHYKIKSEPQSHHRDFIKTDANSTDTPLQLPLSQALTTSSSPCFADAVKMKSPDLIVAHKQRHIGI